MICTLFSIPFVLGSGLNVGFNDPEGLRVIVGNTEFTDGPGGNSSANETYFNTKYWRLDGTNAPPSADWDMGSHLLKWVITGGSNGLHWNTNGFDIFRINYASGTMKFLSISGAPVTFDSGDGNGTNFWFNIFKNKVNVTISGDESLYLFKTDADNNRIGINREDPVTTLDVNGNLTLSEGANISSSKKVRSYYNNSEICTAGNGLCSGGSGFNTDQVRNNLNRTANVTFATVNITGNGLSNNENSLVVGENCYNTPGSGRRVCVKGGFDLNVSDDDQQSFVVHGLLNDFAVLSHAFQVYNSSDPTPTNYFYACNNPTVADPQAGTCANGGYWGFIPDGTFSNNAWRMYNDTFRLISSGGAKTVLEGSGRLIIRAGNTSANSGYVTIEGWESKVPKQLVNFTQNQTVFKTNISVELNASSNGLFEEGYSRVFSVYDGFTSGANTFTNSYATAPDIAFSNITLSSPFIQNLTNGTFQVKKSGYYSVRPSIFIQSDGGGAGIFSTDCRIEKNTVSQRGGRFGSSLDSSLTNVYSDLSQEAILPFSVNDNISISCIVSDPLPTAVYSSPKDYSTLHIEYLRPL